MAGKRLLDAAKLFSAGRAVTKQHISIRQQQWQLLTRTSGLAKAVKDQTDRVTVTVGAAVELAKRFSESGPAWKEGQQADGGRETGSKPPSGNDWVMAEAQKTTEKVGVDPLTIPRVGGQADDGTLASLRRQDGQQREQIPGTAADAQSTYTYNAGRDTFNERSDLVTPDLSTLPRAMPRTRLPEHADETTVEHSTANKELNQDVFPSPADAAEPLPEGVNTDLFHSPKVSQMLGQSTNYRQNPYGTKRQKLPPKPLPEMVQASERWKQERDGQSQSAQSTSEAPPAESATNEADMQDLAASLAKDAETTSNQEMPADDISPNEMHESRVPSTRFGRLWQYSGLATSMAFGAVGESFRRLSGGSSSGSLMLSEGNIERLVAKLSRMRGAALKLGQMISFQGKSRR